MQLRFLGWSASVCKAGLFSVPLSLNCENFSMMRVTSRRTLGGLARRRNMVHDQKARSAVGPKQKLSSLCMQPVKCCGQARSRHM